MDENKNSERKDDWKNSLPLNIFWAGCSFASITFLIDLIISYQALPSTISTNIISKVYFLVLIFAGTCFGLGIIESFKSTGKIRRMGLLLNTSALIFFCFAVYLAKTNL